MLNNKCLGHNIPMYRVKYINTGRIVYSSTSLIVIQLCVCIVEGRTYMARVNIVPQYT